MLMTGRGSGCISGKHGRAEWKEHTVTRKDFIKDFGYYNVFICWVISLNLHWIFIAKLILASSQKFKKHSYIWWNKERSFPNPTPQK